MLLKWLSSKLHQHYWLSFICTIGRLSDCSTNLRSTTHLVFPRHLRNKSLYLSINFWLNHFSEYNSLDLANSFIFSSNSENESPSPFNHSYNLIKFSCSTSFLGFLARRGEVASVFFGWVKSFRQSSCYLASSGTRSLQLRTLCFISSDHLLLEWLLQYFKIASL